MVDENFRPLIEDWKERVVISLVAADETDRLAEYALHMARILAYPQLDVNETLSEISDMGKELYRSLKPVLPLRPTQMIEKINEYLFKVQNFRPNVDDYYNPLNSYLNIVLEKKVGIPITLSILYVTVAGSINFKLYPVNFPAHFLVKHVMDGDSGEIIVDPFNGGRIMDDYALQALLDRFYPKQNIRPTHAFVERATAAQVVVRMLNNLKGSYYEAQDYDRAEIANEMVLAIDQYNPDAIRDKGMIFLKRGKSPEALNALNSYLEIDPEADDADAVLDIIRQIRAESAER